MYNKKEEKKKEKMGNEKGKVIKVGAFYFFSFFNLFFIIVEKK